MMKIINAFPDIGDLGELPIVESIGFPSLFY